MIIVQSEFHLLPDSQDEVLKLMRNMVRLSRKEPGCLTYEYYAGISDPNRVVLLQEWENADYLQVHYQTEHIEDFLSKLGQFLAGPVNTRSYMSRDEAVRVALEDDDEPQSKEQTIH